MTRGPIAAYAALVSNQEVVPVPTAAASRPATTAASGVSGFFLMRMAGLLSNQRVGCAFRSEGSEAVAEVVFERATGLQALGEQGGRAARGSVRGD